jgi:hypothetical protein
MNTISMAPVRKSIQVRAAQAHAFEVFTSGIDRWWPHQAKLTDAPIREIIFEPRIGGRWYFACTDGSEATVGHVRQWDPPHRFVIGWEINARWKPDARVELASEVEVRFIAEGPQSTRIELEHRDFERMGAVDGGKMHDDVDGGWLHMLQLFATAAENPEA